MTRVTPRIFCLGEPVMHLGTESDPGVIQWLKHIGGEEALGCLNHVEGSDVEQVIELMARRCYKSFAPGLNPNVTKIREVSMDYHGNIINQEHGSVVANGGMVTYAFEDVSRVFTHEIVRNSIGTERSQESLRYVRLTDLRFWIPPIIEREKMAQLVPPPPWYALDGTLSRVPMTPEEIFLQVIAACEWAQVALSQYYRIDEEKDFSRKKLLTSAFRRVAPIGLGTGIGISFNLRALRWIIEQRTSPGAEEEMRLVMGMVAEDAIRRWPMIFQDFTKIDTGDGLFAYVPEHSKI